MQRQLFFPELTLILREWRTGWGGVAGFKPARNSEVLTKSNRIAS